MQLLSVNTARPRLIAHRGKSFSSAINKQPQAGPVAVSETGVAGDKCADTRHHGGPLQAVCVYPHEHYVYFAAKLGLDELPVPGFGENFTTMGLLEAELCIGDELRFGSDLVAAITKPREPCSTLARKHDSPDLVRWVHETRYTGFYLRIVTPAPGGVQAGDSIELLDRPHEGLTVADTMRALFDPDADPAMIERYAECESLTPQWRERASKRLAKMRGG